LDADRLTVAGPQAADLAYCGPLADFERRGDLVVRRHLSELQDARSDCQPSVSHFLREARRSADAGDDRRGAYESAASLLAPQQPPLLHVAQGMTHGDSADA